MSRKVWLCLAGGCFLLDIASKLAAVRYLNIWEEVVVIPDFFSLTYTTNRGIAFSMLSDVHSPWKTILLTVAALLAIGFIIRLVVTATSLGRTLGSGLALVLGGILGNISNRLMTGSVVDFLDVHYHRSFTWPTFNLADAFISTGALLILVDVLWAGGKNEPLREP